MKRKIPSVWKTDIQLLRALNLIVWSMLFCLTLYSYLKRG